MKKLRRIILIILMLIAVIIVDYLVIRNTHTWYAVADVTDTGRVKVTMDRDDVVEVTSVKYRERRDGNMLVIKMKAVGKGTANLTHHHDHKYIFQNAYYFKRIQVFLSSDVLFRGDSIPGGN